MSPKPTLKSLIKPDDEFGFMVMKKEEVPAIAGRGRLSLISQLTAAKRLKIALASMQENGVGISEEVFGIDLNAPGTKKEAAKLGIKGLAQSFFLFVKHETEPFKNQVRVTRRDKGYKIFLLGPEVDETRA